MYKNLNLGGLIDSAEKFVLENDRMLYAPFFQRIEEFAVKNGIIYGGKVGTDITIGKPITRDSFLLELYVDNVYNVAKELAEELILVKSPHVPVDTVCLQTILMNRELKITVYSREIAHLYLLDRYRDVKLSNLMTLVTADGYYGNAIKILPVEIQLMDIYRCLYTPARHDHWRGAVDIECVLWEKMPTGRAKFAAGTPELSQQMHKLIEFWRDKAIFVGDYGTALMTGLAVNVQRLHLIAESPLEYIDAMSKHIGSKITYAKFTLCVPNDFQVSKITFYVQTGDSKRAMIDVYDATSYELIPYITHIRGKDQIKIGNPWVILRFILLDSWSLKLAARMSNTNLDYKIQANHQCAIAVREWALKNIPQCFVKQFVGFYIKDRVAKKRFVAAAGGRPPQSYYPAMKKELSRDD